ncbi:MAG: bifunctional hydroxymethylpyrimidine kinase/phosphomethylpyrimidine kinase [Candidatus Hadarchaeota archaeon]
MKVPCALTIAGSDSGGGAGIQADLKTFAAFGVHGLCVVTAVTAQNTLGVYGVHELPPDFVEKQLVSVMKDFDVKWAKTGMLHSSKIIQTVGKGAKKYGLNLVVDPVMAAASGSQLMKDEALDALLKFVSEAEVVTPNIHEAERMAGLKIHSLNDMEKAAREISKLGPRAVLVKGGHLSNKTVTDVLYLGGRTKRFTGPRVGAGMTHGTGCTYSSAITAEMAKGKRLEDAVASARNFITPSIKNSLEVGHGVRPVNQMVSLIKDAEVGSALSEVWRAAGMLADSKEFVSLIPQVGSNIVMALPWAVTTSEVVGLSGRMVRVGGRPILTGFPMLGGSAHVANIVITAKRHDQAVRAGLNIRYSPELVKICKKMGLSVGTFSREKEPRGVKTMIWGTEQAIRRAGIVPQVIFDEGGKGKEAMIRLLGGSAVEVASLALKIAGRAKHLSAKINQAG